MASIQNETISQPTTRPVPTRLLLWLTCGTIGSLLFTTTYLIEGATRPGYNPLQQAISALSLGLGGWVQQVNFVVFGAITIWTAFAWREFLKGGAAIHQIFAFVSITAIALGFFVLARRYAREPGWRGWATYSVINGILTIALIATFGTLNGQHSEIAGLFERLATSLGTIWGLIFFTCLWLGTSFGRFQR